MAQVARRLQAPYETTRRHVGWLVEAGLCRREARGVVAELGRIGGARGATLASENLASLRRMFRQLAVLDEAALEEAAR